MALTTLTKIGKGITSLFKAKGATHARELEDRFSDIINVKDYGAKGDGSIDDTLAIQSALDTEGGIIFFPKGNYKVSGILRMKESTRIQGTEKRNVEIQMGNSGQLHISSFSTVENITFTEGAIYSASAHQVTFSNCYLYNIESSHQDFHYLGFFNCLLQGGRIYGYHGEDNKICEAISLNNCDVQTGAYVLIEDTADIKIINSTFIGGASTLLTVRRGQQPSGFYAPVLITNSVFDAALDVVVNLVGMSPRVTNSFFSGGRTQNGSGLRLEDCIEGSISNIQARYCGNAGLEIRSCKDIEVIGSAMWDSKSRGVLVTDSSIDISFTSCSFGYNSSWWGGSFVQPIGIEDPSSNGTNINVIDCKFKNMAQHYYIPNVSIRYGNTTHNSFLDSSCTTIEPLSTSLYNLGSSAKRWNDLHVDRVVAKGSEGIDGSFLTQTGTTVTIKGGVIVSIT